MKNNKKKKKRRTSRHATLHTHTCGQPEMIGILRTDAVDSIGDVRRRLEIPNAFPILEESRRVEGFASGILCCMSSMPSRRRKVELNVNCAALSRSQSSIASRKRSLPLRAWHGQSVYRGIHYSEHAPSSSPHFARPHPLAPCQRWKQSNIAVSQARLAPFPHRTTVLLTTRRPHDALEG
jgi:hypothetical protein